MRLDKYLKVSRLIKRRTLAKDAAEADRILVNGVAAKPSKLIGVGDEITISYGKKTIVVRVTNILQSTKKDDANLMYELISETIKE